MKWLKRRLRKWLGFDEALHLESLQGIADKFHDIDLQLTSFALTLSPPEVSEPEGELPGLLPSDPPTLLEGAPSIFDSDNGVFVLLDSPRGKELSAHIVKKGYES